jgi:hypothetical protein
MRVITLNLAAFALLSTSPAMASCLNEVSDFAIKICGEINSSGSHTIIDEDGNLDANISSIIRRIVGGGSASVSRRKLVDSYENVLREHLAQELFNVRDCRRKMVSVAVKQVCEEPNAGSPGQDRVKISNIISSSGSWYGVSENRVTSGSRAWSDREAILSHVPDFLSGAVQILTANADKFYKEVTFLSFNISDDADIFVAYDDRYESVPRWLREFQRTRYKVTFSFGSQDYPMTLFKKRFRGGAVELGAPISNQERGNYSMYLVFVLK